MLSVAGADHIITMDLHASQIQVPNSHIQGEHYLKRLRIRIYFIGIRVRIQHLCWIPIRIQGFNCQKVKKKITAEKNFIFFSKTTIYLSLGLHKERPSYIRSVQL